MKITKQKVDPAFIRALKFDYLGEVSTEVNFRLQSLVTYNKEVAAKAKEFADLEAATRQLIGNELERHGVKMGKCLWLRVISYILLLPIKLILPTRLWVHLIYRSTLHALKLYQSQRAKWETINPEFFERLIDHEIKQRDWAEAYLKK
ncbi:MAG: hypothetical protein JNN15_00390 [Blastocatellia bacterium]|nr:hypothetical protein [Blastocatellia bacterium]